LTGYQEATGMRRRHTDSGDGSQARAGRRDRDENEAPRDEEMTQPGPVESTHRDAREAGRGRPAAAAFDVTLDFELLEDAYYEVDLGGRLTRFNEAACQLLGYEPDVLLGKHYREYMPPAIADQVKAMFSEVYRSRQPLRGSDWFAIRSDGTSRRVEGSVSLVRDADGEPVGFCGIMRDVTDRRIAEQALRESEARFRALTSLSNDWYWEQDAEYRMIRFEGSRVVPRYDPARQVIGRRLWDLPGILLTETEWDMHRAALARRESFRDFEYAYQSRSGQRYYVSISGEPIFDAHGTFTGYRGTSRDVTRAKHEQRLLELEHRVTHMLSVANDRDEALDGVLEAIGQSEAWDASSFFDILDDAGRARLAHVHCAAGLPATTVDRYRRQVGAVIERPGMIAQSALTGEMRWIRDVNEVLDAGNRWREVLEGSGERTLFIVPVRGDGRPIGAFVFANRSTREPDERLKGAMRVVADQVAQFLRRKAAEATLRDSEARFRALTHLSSDWYWQLDAELRFARIGGARGDFDSHRGGPALGRRPWEIGLDLPGDRRWEEVQQTLAERKPFRDLQVFRHRRHGGVTWYAISGEPVTDDDGRFAGYRGIGRDITDRVLAEQRIQRMATHDSLTGLPNRAHFTELLQQAIASGGARFSVMFIDLDGFKLVNDTLGHEAGDELLRAAGTRIRGCLRGDDLVARLGGDEFIVLARDTIDDGETRRVADKIASMVGQPLRIGERAVRVTPSIGIARHPDDADGAAGLVRAADLAMYEAKRAGKNRHAFFCDLQPGTAGASDAPGGVTRPWAPV
jgi:diguanylate cyclase (GGDEF)-like protein/PAS domain S-box-containing protein